MLAVIDTQCLDILIHQSLLNVSSNEINPYSFIIAWSIISLSSSASHIGKVGLMLDSLLTSFKN